MAVGGTSWVCTRAAASAACTTPACCRSTGARESLARFEHAQIGHVRRERAAADRLAQRARDEHSSQLE